MNSNRLLLDLDWIDLEDLNINLKSKLKMEIENGVWILFFVFIFIFEIENEVWIWEAKSILRIGYWIWNGKWGGGDLGLTRGDKLRYNCGIDKKGAIKNE